MAVFHTPPPPTCHPPLSLQILAVLGAGFQYWIMQPVFFNMLQVGPWVHWGGAQCRLAGHAGGGTGAASITAPATRPPARPTPTPSQPTPHPNCAQMYAFCNADDISWGTKNLDTKHADHDAKKMASKALAYQVRGVGAVGGSALGSCVAGLLACGTAGTTATTVTAHAPLPQAQSSPPAVPAPPPSTDAQVRPSKTSKAFWDAMSKVQNHLTDAKKIAAYNQKKEQKMRVRAPRLA